MNVKTAYIQFNLLLVFLVSSISNATAQRNDCNANIDWAKALYEQGKIEEVPQMLGDCPVQKTLPKTKRMEALVLVTETYLYLKETEKADSTFLLLLKLNPSFELDSFSLSVELDRLGQTFRTKPIFNVGFNAGANLTFIRSEQSFSPDFTTDAYEAPSNYFLPAYRGGLDLDLPIGNVIELSVGVDLAQRSYRYEDNLINSKWGDDFEVYGQLSFKEKQLWVDFPFAVRMILPRFKTRPYFYVGGHTNLLLSSSLSDVQRNFGETNTLAESLPIFSISNKEEGLRTATNFSLTGGLGIKIPLGLDYLVFDLQYNYQLLNAVNRQNRYSNDRLLYDFLYVDDDFKQSSLAFTIGFSKSIYKPRKKRKSPFEYTTTKERKLQKSKAKDVIKTPEETPKEAPNQTTPAEEEMKVMPEEEDVKVMPEEAPKAAEEVLPKPNKNESAVMPIMDEPLPKPKKAKAKADKKSKVIKSQKPKKDN